MLGIKPAPTNGLDFIRDLYNLNYDELNIVKEQTELILKKDIVNEIKKGEYPSKINDKHLEYYQMIKMPIIYSYFKNKLTWTNYFRYLLQYRYKYFV